MHELREYCVGVRHEERGAHREEAGWLTFLDGVAFRRGERGLRAVYRAHAREI